MIKSVMEAPSRFFYLHLFIRGRLRVSGTVTASIKKDDDSILRIVIIPVKDTK